MINLGQVDRLNLVYAQDFQNQFDHTQIIEGSLQSVTAKTMVPVALLQPWICDFLANIEPVSTTDRQCGTAQYL